MTEDRDCGHNHDPNPYTDPARSEAYGHVVRNLFRMSIITCGLAPELSTAYAACAVVALADPTDRVPTMRAMLWELGFLTNVMAGGREPKMHTHHPDNHHNHLDDDTPEARFGEQTMRAYFAAASVGDLEAAVRVADAVRAEAVNNDRDPDAFLAQFFGNLMVSAAYTARVNYGDTPLSMFEE